MLLAGAAVQAAAPRPAIFISDTHFGVGRDASGAFHPFEDARWAEEFAAFLAAADTLGRGASDLILNGDTFELWQSLQATDCLVARNADAGCSEAEALTRLDRVLSQHATELAALRRFAESGDNRVIIVPGNHDAAIAFPRLAAQTLSRIGAARSRVSIAANGYWLSSDGRIYAEHGHQIGLDPNRFDAWPAPFEIVDGVPRLQRSWGEQFVQKFYNDYERKYPIIDNLSTNVLGVRYGIAAEGPAAVGPALGRFARFYLTALSLSQFIQGLGPDRQPTPPWDIAKIRAEPIQFIVDSLPADDAIKRAVVSRASTNTLDISTHDFTENDINAICTYRLSLFEHDDTHSPLPCPQTSLGGPMQAATTSRDAVFRGHLEQMQEALSNRANAERIALVVTSHTHRASPAFSPFRRPGDRWTPWVVNTGAWQRTMTPSQLEALKTSRHMSEAAVLTLTPEDLPACYPVVVVRPYANDPESELLWWRKGATWFLDQKCD
jgi:UDP-2,3-diacylglucosamine pyrophosphatase LpxH